MASDEINRNGRQEKVRTIGLIGYDTTAVRAALGQVAAENGWNDINSGSDVGAANVAILIVSAVDGPLPDGRAELRLAREADVPLVVALTEVDKIDDPELLDLVKLEVREFVKACGYRSDLPVLHLSDLNALQGSRNAAARLARLVEILDECVSVHP